MDDETNRQPTNFLKFHLLTDMSVIHLPDSTQGPIKKRSEETQTLCAGCSKAEPKIFALPQTPFPGAWDGQILICWRWSLPLPTNPVWWGSMQAILSYRGNRPTHTQTHPPTHRQDRLQYTMLQLVCSVIRSTFFAVGIIRDLSLAGRLLTLPCL